MPERETYLPGAEDRPREVVLTLPAREWAALVYLRDTTFSGQPLELLARKLVQDGLLACGVRRATGGRRRGRGSCGGLSGSHGLRW